jgi:hypothetical protein
MASKYHPPAAECKARLDAHEQDMARNPLTRAEIVAWRVGLSGLDDIVGQVEQLRLCKDMLRHRSEDDMSAYDERIIHATVARLTEQLGEVYEAGKVRRRSRADYVLMCKESATDDSYYSAHDDSVHARYKPIPGDSAN